MLIVLILLGFAATLLVKKQTKEEPEAHAPPASAPTSVAASQPVTALQQKALAAKAPPREQEPATPAAPHASEPNLPPQPAAVASKSVSKSTAAVASKSVPRWAEEPVADAPPAPASPAAPASADSGAPLLHYPGGDFNGSHFVDLTTAPHNFSGNIGGALSISFAARWDALHSWSRVVDFGSGPQSDNIIISNFEKGSRTLVADVYRGTARKRLLIPDVINIKESHEYLLTITAAGAIKMYRDAVLLGELSKGYAPRPVERAHLYVGRSNSNADGLFQGRIAGLKLWASVVEWTTAFPAEAACSQSSATCGNGAAEAKSSPDALESMNGQAEDENECEVSERVSKLKAKKAERKARKAAEKKEEEPEVDVAEALEESLARGIALKQEAERKAAEENAAAEREEAEREAVAKEKADAAAAKREAAAKEEAAKKEAAERSAEKAVAQREAKELQRKQQDADERQRVARSLDSLAAAAAEPEEAPRQKGSNKKKGGTAKESSSPPKEEPTTKKPSWRSNGGMSWADESAPLFESWDAPATSSEPLPAVEAAPRKTETPEAAAPEKDPWGDDDWEEDVLKKEAEKEKAPWKPAKEDSSEPEVLRPQASADEAPAPAAADSPEAAPAEDPSFIKAATTRKAAKAQRAQQQAEAEALPETSPAPAPSTEAAAESIDQVPQSSSSSSKKMSKEAPLPEKLIAPEEQAEPNRFADSETTAPSAEIEGGFEKASSGKAAKKKAANKALREKQRAEEGARAASSPTAGPSSPSGPKPAHASPKTEPQGVTVETLFRSARDAEVEAAASMHDLPPSAVPAPTGSPVSRSIEAPLMASGTDTTQSAMPSTLTPLEKEIMKLEKKLREVEKLRERQASGEHLAKNQLDKIDNVGDLGPRIAEMQLQRAAEKAKEQRILEEQMLSVPVEYDEMRRTSYVCHTPDPEDDMQGHARPRAPLQQWAKNARRAVPFVSGPMGTQDNWLQPMSEVRQFGMQNPAQGQMMMMTVPGDTHGKGGQAGPGDEATAFVQDGHGNLMPVFGGAGQAAMGQQMFMQAPVWEEDGTIYGHDGEERWDCCWEWVKKGWCPRGETCRWEHPPLASDGWAGDGSQMQHMWVGDEGTCQPAGMGMMPQTILMQSPDGIPVAYPEGPPGQMGPVTMMNIPMGMMQPGNNGHEDINGIATPPDLEV